MPKEWSNKRERQYEHIKESAQKRRRSTKRAKQIAAATVNKQRRQAGETKTSSRKSGAAGRKSRSGSRKTAGGSRKSAGGRKRSGSRKGGSKKR